MITVKGKLCLEETLEDIFDYLGNPSPRQLRYLRERYKLPFVMYEGKRVYPIPDLNMWMLGARAPQYNIEQLLHFLTPPGAAALVKKSSSTLAHYRSDGKGPPFYRVGYAVRYLSSDLRKFRTRLRTG